MAPTERIQVASADNVIEFQNQLNYLYQHGYHLLSQSTAPLGDKIIFTAVLEKHTDVQGDPVFEETISIVEQLHENEVEVNDEYENYDEEYYKE
ncbi:MAG TPA: hypothetical protein VJZ27_16140 [Aggregatilineales bacterium]|nr:hypothetical protein [Aggregatilineales bacterium]